MKEIITILLLPIFCFSQIGADESIINNITINETNLAGNAHENDDLLTAVRVFYVATDGLSSNDGLTESSPLDIATAFDPNIVERGDLYWIKAGDYGNHNFDLTGIDPSSTSLLPVRWIGYKNTIGDIVSQPYAGYDSVDPLDPLVPILPSEFNALPSNVVGHKILDSSLMPTFTGDQSQAPNYIVNGDLFSIDGGGHNLIFKNFQVQFYKHGFFMSDLDYSLFENITLAHQGWFSEIEGQGGTNEDLIGDGIVLRQASPLSSEYNIIKNCYGLNHAHTSFSISVSQYNLIKGTEGFSNLNSGNAQDYYFRITGSFNKIEDSRAVRGVASRHSGHGICFNFDATHNMAEDCFIYGTSFHFDASAYGLAKNVTLRGEPSFATFIENDPQGNNTLPFQGGNFLMLDSAHDNLILGGSCHEVGGFSFNDTAAHGLPAHATEFTAGNNNTYRNVVVDVSQGKIIKSGNSNTSNGLQIHSNLWDSCTFVGSDDLFEIERLNSLNVIKNSTIENLPSLRAESNGFSLNSDTIFLNNTWINSQTAETDVLTNFSSNTLESVTSSFKLDLIKFRF